MATVVAAAYPDENTAEQARATVWHLEEELIIQADQAFQQQVRDALQSGTSALFMVIEHATPDWPRPRGATAGGLIGRHLPAVSGGPRESR
jgi:uncharacterized membrane protein